MFVVVVWTVTSLSRAAVGLCSVGWMQQWLICWVCFCGLTPPPEAEDAGLKGICHTVGFLASLHPTHLSWSQSQPNNKRNLWDRKYRGQTHKDRAGSAARRERDAQVLGEPVCPQLKTRRKLNIVKKMKVTATWNAGRKGKRWKREGSRRNEISFGSTALVSL